MVLDNSKYFDMSYNFSDNIYSAKSLIISILKDLKTSNENLR